MTCILAFPKKSNNRPNPDSIELVSFCEILFHKLEPDFKILAPYIVQFFFKIDYFGEKPTRVCYPWKFGL